MSTTAPPAYLAREGAAARDREAVLGLWRGNLGEEARMAAKFDWFYRDSPLGEPLLRILHHGADGPAVGVATAGPRRLRRGERELRGGVLVDLAVLPEHRTLGPALVLQQALIEAAAQRFDLVYGLPNPKAAPVFKRVGYKPLGDMVRYACVLRHARYLARRMPTISARIAGPVLDLVLRLRDAWRRRGLVKLEPTWIDRIDERIEQMTVAASDDTQGLRDAAFLRWRFERGPQTGVRYLLLKRRDALCAWFACHSEDELLHVADYRCSDAGVTPAAIAALLRAARRDGHVAVSVQIAGTLARVAPWAHAGFIARGHRPLFGKWFDESTATPLFLTAADEDE